MLTCPICETVVEKHRPNQKLCGSKRCLHRYTFLVRNKLPIEPRSRMLFSNFDAALFNEVLRTMEVKHEGYPLHG